MVTIALEADKAVQSSFLQTARNVFQIELQAIQQMTLGLGNDFTRACELILACAGRVIVSGMGKSGLIGRKIAATFASTGTPAFFVHPGEACHGDLGMITPDDVLIAISNSGKSDELIALIPNLKRLAIPIISMTGDPKSQLAKHATVNLNIAVKQEACPLGLAPTASTTCTLVMGDALAISLLSARGFTENDFAHSHPGGSLGKRLLIRVQDIMHKNEQIPKVLAQASLGEALLEMTSKGLGMTAVVDNSNQILGIFTDGDLRRTLSSNVDFHVTKISEVMTTDCIVTSQNKLAHDVLHEMEVKKINCLLVADQNNKLIGCLNMHDFLKAKLI